MNTKILLSIIMLGLMCQVSAINLTLLPVNPLVGSLGQQSGIQTTDPKCSNGYGWNGQVCVPCLEVKNGYCTCTNIGQCDSKNCNAGFQKLSGNGKNTGAQYDLCLDVANGCVSYTWDTAKTSIICTQCAATHQMIAGICVQLNNCAQINYVTGTCDACSDGYYFTQNFQLQVLQSVTYYQQLNNVICNQCMSSCAICTSQYTCITCSTGFFWTPTTQTTALTDNTNAGYCQSCKSTVSNCAACSNSTTCDKCSDGFYYTAPTTDANSKGTCTGCIANCSLCSAANQCDQCNLTSALQTLDGGQNSCTQCSTITGCIACNYNTSNTLTCTACSTPYALDTTNNKCVSCPGSCSACSYNTSNVLQCDNCTTLTQVWDGTKQVCSSCPLNCSRPNCTVDNGTGQCKTCDSTYVWDGTVCQSCTKGTLTNCLTCTWSNGTPSCQTCSTGYVKSSDGNYCYPCPGNCITCGLNNTGDAAACTQCADTYYLANSTTCTLCSSTAGFLRCTTAANATQCQNGYFLLGNTCYQNTTANKLNLCLTIKTSGGSQVCDTCLPSSVGSNNGNCYYCNCLAKANCSLSTDGNNTITCSPSPTCLPGYYKSGSTCVICSGGASACCPAQQILSGSNAVDYACTSQTTTGKYCIESTQSGTCKCDVGYYSTSGGGGNYCTACISNCDTCADGSTCTTCSLGYTYVGSTCVKIKCLDMTYYYSTDSGCQACQYGFYLATINQINYCLQCISPLTIGFGTQNNAICRPYSNTAPNVTPTPTTTTGTVIKVSNGTVTSAMASRGSYYCDNGYFWNNQYCSPCGTVSNGYCVCTSYKQCTSIVCSSGYSLVQNACLFVPTGCTSVALSGDGSTVVCTNCQSGYTLIGNVCLPNQNCAQFNSSTGNCSSCSAGFYLNWQYNTYISQPKFEITSTTPASPLQSYYFNLFPTQCTACTISNCQLCNGPTVCTTCNTGYYWLTSQYQQQSANGSQGSCQPCMQGCQQCVNNQSCQTCFPGYYAVYPYSGINYCQLCLNKISNCLTCDNSTSPPHQQSLLPTCRTCQTGFFLTGNKCVICPAGCTACDADNSCTSCATGYYKNPNAKQCVACSSISGCQSCSYVNSTLTCQSCQDTYYLSTTNNNNSCQLCSNVANQNYQRCNSTTSPTQCQDGYYLNGSSCTKINSTLNCLTFTDNGLCTSCVDGYIIVSNQCKPCGPPTQNIDAKCIKCQVISNTGSASTLQCAACASGYYLNSSNSCQACANVTGCDVCTSNGCSSCLTSYYPVNVQTDSTNTSTGSSTGTSNNSVTCSKCPNNCLQCQQANSCTKCSDGYFLVNTTSGQTTTSSCYACQPECATCVAPGTTCTSCYTGYVFSNGGCVSLAQANCYTAGSNGCAICIYGYYLSGGVCYQCLNPQADFLCTNPVNNLYTSVKTS